MAYTAECQAALESARAIAAEFDGAEVSSLHLMMGVAAGSQGRWMDAVASLGLDPEGLNAILSRLGGEGGLTGDPGAMSYSDNAKGALKSALRACRDTGVFVVDCEHLFFGAVAAAPSEVTAELAHAGLTPETYSAALDDLSA